ncbi:MULTISPECIES: hypothetical protein [Oscillatoriales]|uniref:hypothetical protein n=1 Tax=Oscillatoriophycideae TaxID=1301283 RepID=UPI001684445B|nr:MULTISPECIES: hypothetical protein [Oscillatoriales]
MVAVGCNRCIAMLTANKAAEVAFCNTYICSGVWQHYKSVKRSHEQYLSLLVSGRRTIAL